MSEDHIVVVDVLDGPTTAIGVTGCAGWGEAMFRVFDPRPTMRLTSSLLDLDRVEQAAVEIELTVE